MKVKEFFISLPWTGYLISVGIIYLIGGFIEVVIRERNLNEFILWSPLIWIFTFIFMFIFSLFLYWDEIFKKN